MTTGTAGVRAPLGAAPDHVPAEWLPPTGPPTPPARDVPLDLVRGLAIAILVVNHLPVASGLRPVTEAVLSAAEVLVLVSGVVAGMVFGRRWTVAGAAATSAMLLRRSRKLYLASVVVVAAVGVLSLVPGVATEALTVSPTMQPPRDLYAFDGLPRTVLAILTLEAGPWQFSILGFFIVVLAATPAVLWALARGWWPAVLAASWMLFAAGRAWEVDVLPAQSERAFPILVWQVLFVTGVVVGWHRTSIEQRLRAHRRAVVASAVAAAVAFAGLQVAGPVVVEPGAWARWEAEHFDKTSLDVARMLAMTTIAAAVYLGLRRWAGATSRLAPVLLPLGRNSFYIFIVHVFVCLAVASMLQLAGPGPGAVGSAAAQLTALALLWAMARSGFLFRWIPR